MKSRISSRGTVGHSLKRIFYYCAFGVVLSTIAGSMPGAAQENLRNLLGRLEQIQGSSGSTANGTSTPALNNSEDEDGALSVEPVEKISPFVFDAVERRMVKTYCTRKQDNRSGEIFDLGDRYSLLEKDYCRRIGDSIYQFGYELFGVSGAQKNVGNGSIQDEYVLGIGDQLIVSFFGHERKTSTNFVDREGRIIVGDFPPVSVVGMTFGDFRRWLEARTRESMFKTKPIVSLGSVRSVSVTVAGEILNPGVHRLTSLSSILDAINMAGGIKKTGSFRRVQVYRGDQIIWVDIYDLLLARDGGQDLSLRDGDKIVVPLIGITVAITGRVLRPAIYELAEGQKTIPVSEVLKFAGGTIRPQGNIIRRLSFDAGGRESSTENANLNVMASGGDIILVARREDFQLGVVELSGHIRTPGKRALASTPTIRSLVQDRRVFRDNPYLLFAVLETTDPTTLARRHFPINLQRILSAEEDFALRENDRLIVFSQADIRFLTSLDVREIISGKSDELVANAPPPRDSAAGALEKADGGTISKPRIVASNTKLTRDIIRGLAVQGLISDKVEVLEKIEQDLVREQGLGCRGLQTLSKVVLISGAGRFRNVGQEFSYGNQNQVPDRHVCPRVFDEIPELLPFVLEHLVTVSGEVRLPGAYPVTPNTPLSSIVAVVGGLTRNVDLSIVEISKYTDNRTTRQLVNIGRTSMQTIVVNPGDIAKFNTRFTDRDSGSVFLSGEFLRSGNYDIKRGEKLSEVIARAGGLTRQAFPYGAIFTRERVKIAQKQGFQRAARELKSAAMFSAGAKGAGATSVLALDKITEDIKNAVALGRVVIESDPTVLQVRPELDSVLEPGDRVFMPKRPNSIMIIGDVLNPGALQFIAGTRVDSYVQQAGGLQKSADEDRMFLVYPNGVAQPVSVSAWNYNPIQVPPGSTIVVPKDPAPLDLFAFARDITSLLSQMAITAASLAVIGNN